MWKRWILYLFCSVPVSASGAVVFEFESVCTAGHRNTDCSFFGLNDGDPVTGVFMVDEALGAPGAISSLSSDQYQLSFTFGSQSFTEQDATSTFNFLVSGSGAALSSMLGNFENANGAQLTLLTVATANLALAGHEADTFGGGGGWTLAEGSNPFPAAIPVPASLWLLLSGLSALSLLPRRAGIGQAG
jgi:hypothetical protein